MLTARTGREAAGKGEQSRRRWNLGQGAGGNCPVASRPSPSSDGPDPASAAHA